MIAALSVAAAVGVLPAATPVAAGPTNSGSVKVAVRIDGSGQPQVLQDRSGYVYAVSPGTQPTATRNGIGRYSVILPVITAPGGTVHLAPWASRSSSNPPVCVIEGWYILDTATGVDVACFDAATGAPREGTRFDVLYTNVTVGFGRLRYTYLWSGDLLPATPTAVDEGYYFSGRGAATPTVERLARGRYVVRFSESLATWTPIVTAYGNDPRWCQTSKVTRTGASTTAVEVVCFRPGGRSADSLFTLMMAGGNPLTGGLLDVARLRINRPIATGLITQRLWNVSAGATPNTYEFIDTGAHTIVMPGVRGPVDIGVVQAYSPFGVRCFIAGLVSTVTDPGLGGYRSACFHPTGGAYGTRVWAIRNDLTPTS